MSASALTIEYLSERIAANPRDAAREFRRGGIPPAFLREIGRQAESAGVRLFLSLYPETPGRVLAQLHERDPSPEISLALAENLHTPAAVLARLARSESAAVRRAVAGARGLSPLAAEILAGDSDPMARAALAENPGVPPRIRGMLADDAAAFVRLALLRGGRSDAELCRRLLADEDPAARAGALTSPGVSDRVLLEAADSDDELTQALLLGLRDALPDKVAESLCFSRHPDIRMAAIRRRELAPDEMLGWAENGEDGVRAHVAGRDGLPGEVQAILAKDACPDVRRCLAANPSLCGPVADGLSNDPDSSVRTVLAANPCLTPGVVARLCIDLDADVVKAAARREGLSAEHILLLAGNGDDTIVYHAALAGADGAHLPAEHSHRFAESRLPTLRAFVAGAPSLSDPIRARLLADPAPSVRLRLTGNPGLTAEELRVLGADPDPRVRAAAIAAERSRQEAEAVVAAGADAFGDAAAVSADTPAAEGVLRRMLRRVLG